MDELEKNVVQLFKEEHQAWVLAIQEAEKTGEGIDINLGGGFADRLEKLLLAFREFKQRHKKKKGLFG
jgi:hypothetical protein